MHGATPAAVRSFSVCSHVPLLLPAPVLSHAGSAYTRCACWGRRVVLTAAIVFCCATQCTSRESCGLKDPIRNFMSYTSGTCMDMFTAEQARRMRCCLESYRSSLFSTSSMPPAPPPSTSYVPQPASVSATTCICASTWTWGSSGSCGVTQNGCTTDTACQDWWFSPSPPPPGLSWCKVRYT